MCFNWSQSAAEVSCTKKEPAAAQRVLKCINAAQNLLKQQMPTGTGFQDVILGKTLAFEVEADEFVQILHNGHNHWLAISTIGAAHPEVLVYDSMYPSTSTPAKQQIAGLLATSEKVIQLTHMDVQMQSGGYDCGLCHRLCHHAGTGKATGPVSVRSAKNATTLSEMSGGRQDDHVSMEDACAVHAK